MTRRPRTETPGQRARRWRRTAAWKRLARDYIFDNPLCEQCLKAGRRAAAVEVDHIRPVVRLKTFEQFLEVDNLQALCPTHHKAKTAAERPRRRPAQSREVTDWMQWLGYAAD